MSKEAMKLALEALKRMKRYGNTFGYRSNEQNPYEQVCEAIEALEALAQQPAQQALDKKAENSRELGLDYEPAQQGPVAWKLVPKEPTHEMLKAMDECSTEGYDERLYAGHASSVYMAAVDAAPTPPAQQEPVQNNPLDCGVHLGSGKDHAIKHHVSYGPAQRTWVGLTEDEANEIVGAFDYRYDVACAVESKLREKNNG